MGRTVALLGACALVMALLACGADPIDAEAPADLQAPTAEGVGATAAILVGRAEAAEAARREAAASEPQRPKASLDPQGRLEIPPEAHWSSVKDALRDAAHKRRTAESLPSRTPVEVQLPNNGGVVLVDVDGQQRPSAASLALWLRSGPPPTTQVTALGTAWIAELGCDATTTWNAASWSLALWQDALRALHGLPDDATSRVRVRPDGDIPAETVLRFLAEVHNAGGDPPLVDTRRWRRREDEVEITGNWLSRHQAPTGAWDDGVAAALCDGHSIRGAPAGGDPKQAENAGLTGLCLCTFLGAGYTNRGKHPYKDMVSKGLRHLKNLQQPDGTFPTPAGWDSGVNHALASMALLEAYGMTGSPIFKGAAQRALSALGSAYQRTREDMLPIALTAMALKSALLINEDAIRRKKKEPLAVDDTLKELLLRHVQGIDLDTGDFSAACALLTRLLLEADAYKAPEVKAGALVLAKALAARTDAVDPAMLFFSSLACFRVGRNPWKIMKGVLTKHAIETQRKDGHTCCAKGSWDPHEPARVPGGRVAATALNALCLEIYYRYDRVLGVR